MRRLFYISLGAAAGIVVARKLTQTAQRYTPSGMSQGVLGALGGLGDSIRHFADEVRVGMAEREQQLVEGLGLDHAHDSAGTLG